MSRLFYLDQYQHCFDGFARLIFRSKWTDTRSLCRKYDSEPSSATNRKNKSNNNGWEIARSSNFFFFGFWNFEDFTLFRVCHGSFRLSWRRNIFVIIGISSSFELFLASEATGFGIDFGFQYWLCIPRIKKKKNAKWRPRIFDLYFVILLVLRTAWIFIALSFSKRKHEIESRFPGSCDSSG